jgi:hypothetical protein
MTIVIRSEFIAEDIRKEIASKGATPMLIDAFNKTCKDTQLYNLQSSTSLADAVLKGLDAYQIHDLVNCYEQGGFDPDNKVDYTCWFEFCRPMKAEMLTKEMLGNLISEWADEIAYRTLENPMEFKDIYTCYVTPMVVLQKDMN